MRIAIDNAEEEEFELELLLFEEGEEEQIASVEGEKVMFMNEAERESRAGSEELSVWKEEVESVICCAVAVRERKRGKTRVSSILMVKRECDVAGRRK